MITHNLFSVWFGQDFEEDFKYAIDGPKNVRNLTDFSTQFRNNYTESDVVDKFEEIFLPKSNVSVFQVINIIWIFRSLYRIKEIK